MWSMDLPCDPSTTTLASIEDTFFGGDNEDIVSSSNGKLRVALGTRGQATGLGTPQARYYE